MDPATPQQRQAAAAALAGLFTGAGVSQADADSAAAAAVDEAEAMCVSGDYSLPAGTSAAAGRHPLAPFTVRENHPGCPPGRPHGTVDKDGALVLCHPTAAKAQDLALRLAYPDVDMTGAPGGVQVGAGLAWAPGALQVLVPDTAQAAFDPGEARDQGGKWTGHGGGGKPRSLGVQGPAGVIAPDVGRVTAKKNKAQDTIRLAIFSANVDNRAHYVFQSGNGWEVATAPPPRTQGHWRAEPDGRVFQVTPNFRAGTPDESHVGTYRVVKKTAANAAGLERAQPAGAAGGLDPLGLAAKGGDAGNLHAYWSAGEGAAKIRWGQQAHGLKVDGLVGPLTTAALRAKPAGKPGRPAKTAHQPARKQAPAKAPAKQPAMPAPASGPARHAAAPAAGDDGVQVPALATIPGVDILAAGTWQLSTGRQTFTRADLAHAIDAAKCPAVGPPIIKIGHLDKRFALKAEQDGEPALGRVTNLRLAADGHKLQGDLAGMPGWLGAVAASAFPRRSVEGKYRFTCQVGHVHPFVLTALALLGVTPPGVGVLGGLDDIARLYGVTAKTGGQPWATAPTDQTEGGPLVAVTEEDVRRAYYANAGAPPTWWITELQMAPTQLIIADEDTGKTFRVPFTISGSAVAFGQPEELASYEDVAAARGTGTIVAYASAADSRSVIAAWDAAAQVANLGDNPSAGAIRALFALPGDSKSSSSLPHHSVSASDHQVGGPDLAGCQAAIGALNGARGGLSGVGADAKKAAYAHLAAHVRDLGGEPAEFKADADPDGQGGGGELEFDAAGNHGSFSGKHKHPHAAYGAQGQDETHDHPHSHDGDGVHQHAHDPVSAAPDGGQPTRGGSDMEFTDDQMAAIRAKLGKKDGEDITPDDIAAAFSAPAVAASAAGDGLPEIGDGTYLVDAEILRDYQQRAAAGDHAVGELARNERDQVIKAAVGAGKFSQARIEHYERKWDSDPEGTRREIEALAAGLVPVGKGPVGKMGFDPDLGGDFEGQQAYKQLYPEDLTGQGVAAAPGVARGGRR